MADKTMLFTVDASEIVAKLHFAGLQPVKGDVAEDNGFIVNTGIVDDDPAGSPDNIGKTRFDLKNSSGVYQLGLVRDFSYNMLFALENAVTDVSKMRAEMLSKKQDKKLLDKNNAEDAAEDQKFTAAVETIMNAFTRASQTYKDVKVDMPKKEDFKTVDGLEKVRAEAVRIQNQFAASDFNAKVSDAKANALKILQAYMDVFAGKDNVKKMTKDSIQAIQVSSNAKGPNDKNLVKDFEIQAISNKELNALNAAFKTKALTEYNLFGIDKETGKEVIMPDIKQGEYQCDVKMCFFVNYTLTVEGQ